MIGHNSKSRPKVEKREVDPLGRHYSTEWTMHDCDAYQSLSLSARELLRFMQRRNTGANNGRIMVSLELGAAAIGVKALRVVTAAFEQLIDRGFLIRTYQPPKGVLRQEGYASCYLITCYPGPDSPTPMKRYLQWRPDRALPPIWTDPYDPVRDNAVDIVKVAEARAKDIDRLTAAQAKSENYVIPKRDTRPSTIHEEDVPI